MAENIERDLKNLTSFSEIVRKFVQRLGDPSKFEYRGECIDLGGPEGKCTCDHPIRFMFLIHGPNGEVAPCGSECINHFAAYNPALFERMQYAKEKLFDKLNEEEKAKKEALRQAEKDRVKPDFDAAEKRFREVAEEHRRKKSRWLPYAMWRMEEALNHPKEYKTTNGYIKFYTKTTAEINKLLGMYERGELNR